MFPAGFRQIMEAYRRDLVETNKDGMTPMDAGPVTLEPDCSHRDSPAATRPSAMAAERGCSTCCELC